MATARDEEGTVADPRDAAEEAGLRYVEDTMPGLTRRKSGTGFAYRDARGQPVRDAKTLARIRALAIPPAYTDVWICPRANGHIQATGRDAKGRKQYRYHPDFRAARDLTKFEHVMAFADALPAIRARVDADMGRRDLPREKVLATVVHLLETTLIRVGNDDYARTNKSFGLTTLRDRHARIEGSALTFRFKGKSGKTWDLGLKDRRVARIVKACQDLPGQELFQYRDADGTVRDVTSADVNAYLREITGQDITAKDFRTWAGTVLAALALQEFEAFDSEAKAKKNLRAAIEGVAARLGNTPTICRKCYIHPQVLDCYLEGALLLQIKDAVEDELREDLAGLKPEEAAVLGLLQARLAEVKDGKGRDLSGARAGKTAGKRRATASESPQGQAA
ncbi:MULTISPECIES: DNA topoisomerase IB [unclassified Methylobacterium]|uniref:DNA topoisomerase IB n=1 Tax=unclassified Methylobacterium TaxID=2615210 RepID=UPI0006F84614|nr:MULTISPECIES: DNA topoisomerase IB [unclassified Methylobacterium]KQO65665.1 DNA topoisomerase I [Methylobacterium sp. Leaf88]KQO67690.1 DNA topoisomerase I [Methylobacterium sp. Leaf89]KQT73462.1 DNA topoisomerase I [Methylobacterium sp. Leaf465]KQU21004.1 DNA topoisomerase I [Methylobacterium sp. Leaf94]